MYKYGMGRAATLHAAEWVAHCRSRFDRAVAVAGRVFVPLFFIGIAPGPGASITVAFCLNFCVRAVVGLARDKQGPAGDDAAIRTEVFQAIGQQPWAARVEVGVKGGMELSGVILNDHERAARIVATEKRFRRRGA
jgi:hypothetical protein